MTVTKRYLLPPILKTILSFTLSAILNVSRKWLNDAYFEALTILNQAFSGTSLSGCFSQKSFKAFLEITCIHLSFYRKVYLILRCLSNTAAHAPAKRSSSFFGDSNPIKDQTLTTGVMRKITGVRPSMPSRLIRSMTAGSNLKIRPSS